MPLTHSKTPAAFKKNIKTELAHNKPQKQAVAIAYSEQRKAQHKDHYAGGGCVGASCKGCSDPSCYAGGGMVPKEGGGGFFDTKRRYDNEKGVSFAELDFDLKGQEIFRTKAETCSNKLMRFTSK